MAPLEPRVKKLIGVLVGAPLVFVYIGLAAWLGSLLPETILLQLPFYLVAGVIWAFPAKYAVLWMNRPVEYAHRAQD